MKRLLILLLSIAPELAFAASGSNSTYYCPSSDSYILGTPARFEMSGRMLSRPELADRVARSVPAIVVFGKDCGNAEYFCSEFTILGNGSKSKFVVPKTLMPEGRFSYRGVSGIVRIASLPQRFGSDAHVTLVSSTGAVVAIYTLRQGVGITNLSIVNASRRQLGTGSDCRLEGARGWFSGARVVTRSVERQRLK